MSVFVQPKKQEMPVSPLVLGLFLFLVIGSAVVSILNNSERNEAMMDAMNQWAQGTKEVNLKQQAGPHGHRIVKVINEPIS